MAISIAVLDCDLLLYGRGHQALERFQLDEVTDEDLVSMFGFPRSFIHFLVNILGRSLSRRTLRSRAISPEIQILAALGFYTSGCFQTRMGDAIGISQASMSRCVANVTEALAERASQYIHFPVEEGSVMALKELFYGLAGMCGVLGALDCTPVAIKAPNGQDLMYVNQKGLHALNCLFVCDAKGMLLSAETHWPGSLPNSSVLERSILCNQFKEDVHVDGWLLGNSSFPLQSWLMTPLNIPQTSAELHYNMVHSQSLSIIDHTIQSLRTRFCCLDGSKGTLQYSASKCSQIILACCVLHNIALEHGLSMSSLPVEISTKKPHPKETVEQDLLDSRAEHIRQELVLSLTSVNEGALQIIEHPSQA